RFREFPGEPYNAGRAEEEVRDLLDTGAFAGIRLEETPQPATGLLDLTLHVREGKPDGYHVYAGLGSYEGPFLGGGYYHHNAFHRLLNFTAGLEVSAIGLLGEVGLTDPWFLETDLRFTTRGFILARQFDGYDKLEAGGGAELSWDVNRFYTIAAHFTSSFVTLNADGISPLEIGPDNYFLNVAGIRQTYDRRDDETLPTNGWFAQLETDAGLTLGDDSVSFLRSEGQLSVYQPVIGDTSHIAVGARAGVIVPAAGAGDLPIDLRFFNGGSNTVRSYRQRELGPRAASGDPRGGESYWITNAEYIHTIKGIASAVAFWDAGTLNRDHGDLFSGTIHYAAGLGVRLELPIGPVRLEYGHNLNPDDGGPSGTWHFAIGTTF
ncbi:MAG: BamA/TamA family outer membrane protein, partial [Akkermansiaceae bacterium]|nr:BamA/TamA family outer membrane protein [Akkermansiaceae bacterium]